MQTPRKMALHERGTLDCAKCLHDFGDNVLLDGEPVTCPKCGHRTVPAVRYTKEGQRIVAQNEQLKLEQKIVVGVTAAWVCFSFCVFDGGVLGFAIIVGPFSGYALWNHLDGKRSF